MNKLVLSIFILCITLTNNIQASTTNLNNVNSKEYQKNLIISKVLYTDRYLDKNIYLKFKNLTKNKEEKLKLKKLLLKDLKIKREMWRSVKLSYKYRVDTETKLLKEYLKKYKVEEKLKGQIRNLIIHAVFRENLTIDNKHKIILNILTIDNMIQKYKDSLILIEYLFNDKYLLKKEITLNNKKNIYNFYLTTGFEIKNGKMTKIYAGKYNNDLYSIQIQKSHKITNTILEKCVKKDAYEFFKKEYIEKNIRKTNNGYEYSGIYNKNIMLYTKCYTNQKRNKLYKKMFFGTQKNLNEIKAQERIKKYI